MYEGSITDVSGLLIGHAQDTQGLTGVTVLLAQNGAVAGVDVRGSASGNARNGSYGADDGRTQDLRGAFDGRQRVRARRGRRNYDFLRTERHGREDAGGIVPTVPSAVIYDLEYGSSDVRPNAGMGYAACINARKEVQQGSIGAGIGATVGKVLGMKHCQKGGIGTASHTLPGGSVVGAIACVNALGDIYDEGKIIAGAHRKKAFINASEYLMTHEISTDVFSERNTTLGILATDASLTRDQAAKLAQIGQDGLARAISPVHTMVDGDTVFGVSYGQKACDFNCLLTAAAEVMRRAIVNAAYATGAPTW